MFALQVSSIYGKFGIAVEITILKTNLQLRSMFKAG
jgi:hypothetical protein